MRVKPVENNYLEKRESQSVRLIPKELVVDNFAAKLKNLRINKHLTRDQLAAQLGVSKHQVRLWETGKCIPNRRQLLELLRLFKVPQLYLVQTPVDEDSMVIVERESLKENKGEVMMNSLEVVNVTNKTFGENLKSAREAKGWSRRELSQKLQSSYNTITNWESGVSTPAVAELLKLSKVLNISACELLNIKPSTLKFEVAVKGRAVDTFSARMQVARLQKGLKRNQLADLLDVTAPSITSWEGGRTTPNIETLMKLSDVLEAPLEFLLEGKKKRSNRTKKSVANLSLLNREEIIRMNATFSKRLRERRLEHSLSQGRLAKAIEVTPMMIYKWETGRAVPSKDSIQRLLNFFKMSLEDFLETSTDQVTEPSEGMEQKVVERIEKEDDSRLEAPSVVVEINKPAFKKPVKGVALEAGVVKTEELSEELSRMVECATKEAHQRVTEVMNQFAQRVVSEVANLNQDPSHQLDLSDSEIKLVEQVRQLDEAEMTMLQSYLDYLTLKK